MKWLQRQWKNRCRLLTLGQSVKGTDGGGVGGDTNLLLRHGALHVHHQGAVNVCVQVVHHSGGECHIHQPSFTVIAVETGKKNPQ